jgi:hypothetical protein
VDPVNKEEKIPDMLHITAEVKGRISDCKKAHIYLGEENGIITMVIGAPASFGSGSGRKDRGFIRRNSALRSGRMTHFGGKRW